MVYLTVQEHDERPTLVVAAMVMMGLPVVGVLGRVLGKPEKDDRDG